MAIHGFMYRTTLVGAAVAALLVGATSVGAQAEPASAGPSIAASGDRGASYWTPARRVAAQPRDLVIDERGLGYLQRADGTLEPYGHSVAAASIPVRATAPAGSAKPQAGPPSGGGGSATLVTGVDPADGVTIGVDHEFRATVTDGDGIRSVDFVLSNGQSVPANRIGTSDVYGIDFTGFTDGNWSWTIVARDNSKRGGTITELARIDFTVASGGTPPETTAPPPTTAPPGSCGGGSSIVVNEPWTCGGDGGEARRGTVRLRGGTDRRAGPICGAVGKEGGEVLRPGVTGSQVAGGGGILRMPGDLLGDLGKPRIGNDHKVDEKQSGDQGNFFLPLRDARLVTTLRIFPPMDRFF